MRAFVAIRTPSLPPELNPEAPGAVPTHLTLRFLGEVDLPRLEAIGSAFDEALNTLVPYDLRLGGVSAFPSPERPRVVWVGVREGEAETVELARKVDGALAPFGFPPEDRPFIPHVTLFRVRTLQDRDRAREWLDSSSAIESSSIRIREVTIQKSTLTAAGAVHEIVHRSPFHGSATPPLTSTSEAP